MFFDIELEVEAAKDVPYRWLTLRAVHMQW
jgi:hypothetical protein